MTRRWSLSRRLILWFALATTGLVATISIASAFYLARSASLELDSLVSEEIDEVRALFEEEDVTARSFERQILYVADQHREYDMAWRVYSMRGEVLDEFGATEILRDLALDDQAPQTVMPMPGMRWHIEDIATRSFQGRDASQHAGAVRVGLLLDGRGRLGLVRSYGFVAMALIGIGALLAIAGGVLFSRHLSRTLRAVAERARGARASGARVELEGAPEEIREVAEAFDETLANIRAEEERARLLIAGMAHELRSPLQNLLGETEILLLRDRDPLEYRQTLESHAEELRDLARVVDNLVTLCATREGGGVLRERFDLGEEIALRLDRERAVAARNRLRLSVQTAGDLRLAGDREALVLVVRNLVGNALHWAPPESEVRLALCGDERHVEITVDDAGVGVPEEERERIFEPFYRGRAKNGQRVGYGLGLALSRSAVQAHGGRIAVGTSSLGGASFTVTLPKPIEAAA